MTRFVEMARQLIADGKIPARDMLVLAEDYVATLERHGPQSRSEVSDIKAFIAGAEAETAPGARQDLAALRLKIAEMEE
jgi:hypothetical protein